MRLKARGEGLTEAARGLEAVKELVSWETCCSRLHEPSPKESRQRSVNGWFGFVPEMFSGERGESEYSSGFVCGLGWCARVKALVDDRSVMTMVSQATVVSHHLGT